VIDWLLWWALVRVGEQQLSERVRESSLEQIAEGGFAEYFEPFTGEPLGSKEQSWTAALVLDWLASGPQRELRAA
jgi:glucosylglycerate hydrolase